MSASFATRRLLPRCGGCFGIPALLVAVLLQSIAAGPAWADAIDDYNVALNFYRQQQWEHAEESFRKFVATYSQHERTPAARLYQGQALVHQRRFAPARDIFRTFVETHRDHPDRYLALYRIGECSYFLGDFDAARTELDRFISAFPKHELAEWALQYLGETQLRLKDPKAASATLQVQLERFPEGRLAEDARFLLGRAWLAQGDREKALAAFQQLAASETGGRVADAQLEVGMLLYDDQKFAEARTAFDAVRARAPQSPLVPVADLNSGYACYHLGEFEAAIQRFDRAGQSPAHANEARFWKGMSYKSNGEFPAAVDVLKALAETPQVDETLALKARFHWADAELRRGDAAAAQSQFLVVVDKSPMGPLAPDALHLATDAALQQGNLDEAERLHARFAKSYSGSGLWLLQRLLHGRIELARGDRAADAGDQAASRRHYSAAVTEFDEVLKESQVPRTGLLARLLLARAQDRLEQPAEVVQTLEPVMTLLRSPTPDEEFAEAAHLTARAYLKLDRAADAADAAQFFITRFPTHPQFADALSTLAVSESRLQHEQQVDAALDQLWKNPDDRTRAQRTTYQLAEQAYAQKSWSRAAQLFQRLVDGGGGDLQTAALTGLGYSEHEAGRHAQAADAFGKLIDSAAGARPLASDAAHMRALSLRLAGQVEQAATAYAAAVRQFALPADAKNLTPEDLQVVGNVYQCARGLARLQRDLKQLDAADRAYETAFSQLQLLPSEQQSELDPLLHEWAVLHYQAQQYARSDELFAKLIALRPDSPLADDARLYIGESHYFANRFDQAKEAFRQLESDPRADEFTRQRALVLLLDIAADQRDWQESIRLAAALRDAFPQSDQRSYAEYRLGEAQLRSGALEAAVETLTSLEASKSDTVRRAEWFPSVRLLLAESLLQAKKYADVEAVIGRFRTEDAASPLLYQADEILGRRFKNEARWKEAREAFQRVVDSESGRRTETAAKAQLLIAETWLLEEQLAEAVGEYYKVYLNYSFPDFQAPALFQAAQCDERLRRWDSAIKSYETLIEKFPEHEYAKKAQPLLEAARKRLPTETLTPESPTSN